MKTSKKDDEEVKRCQILKVNEKENIDYRQKVK